MTVSSGATNDDTTSGTAWYNQTFIAAIAAVISLVSIGLTAYYASNANGVAAQQALNGEQQELVTLITDIAQEPVTIAQETASIQRDPAALHNAEVGTQLTELAEAEEAKSLLGVLPTSSLTAIDYYYTAMGLEAGESNAQAYSLLQTAGNMSTDPRTSANILRAEAQILYEGGDAKGAANDIRLAFQAFSGRGVTPVVQDYNRAYTDFFDAQYQAQLDCQRATSEVTDGKQQLTLIERYPHQDTTELEAEEALDSGVTSLPPGTGTRPGPCKASGAPPRVP
jgi:hypothetical protein